MSTSSRKIRMFLYPGYRQHSQDDMSHYVNTVPFSRKGIGDWVKECPAHEAELFYMGQITGGAFAPLDTASFEHFAAHPECHVADQEGDELPETCRTEFLGSVTTATCAPPAWSNINVCVRPNLSRGLIAAVHDVTPAPIIPNEVSFGFAGFPDHRCGIRAKTGEALRLAELPGTFELTPAWNGPADPESYQQKRFKQVVGSHLIALVPQGQGIGTARQYEVCAMARVPVVIGENLYCGHDFTDTSFAYQVPSDLTTQELAGRLQEIADAPISELKDRAQAARNYFDVVVREYFADPTAFFIRYMIRKGIIAP